MILQGNQRGGAKDLALHLLKTDNDFVDVHELRGFISDDLVSALNEAYAISRGTKAKQFLFSLSLNPPPAENVSTEVFVDAINRVEEKLGLTGQPRGIVFHVKQGVDGQSRRHCHAVWSRIDVESMKAIELPYTHYKLRDLSRELYIEQGWEMPQGFLDSKTRDPRNFNLAEWQHAKRQGKDPRAIKSAIQDSWAISDTQNAFQSALKERGFTLARGDRRGVVVLDHACEVYSLTKWLGLKAKQVKSRLTAQEALPTVADAKAEIAQAMVAHLTQLQHQHGHRAKHLQRTLKEKRSALIEQQIDAQNKLKVMQEKRWATEVKQRQARYNKGLRGLIDRVLGRHKRIKVQNEQETLLASQRDQRERDALIFRQMAESQQLQRRAELVERVREKHDHRLDHDIAQYNEINRQKRDVFECDRQEKAHRPDSGLEREP